MKEGWIVDDERVKHSQTTRMTVCTSNLVIKRKDGDYEAAAIRRTCRSPSERLVPKTARTENILCLQHGVPRKAQMIHYQLTGPSVNSPLIFTP